MSRSRLVSLLGGALLAALLLPSTSLAAGPAPVADPAIELGCALVIPVPRDTRPSIVCRWSALEGAEVRAYRLWRIVDDRPRRLLATVGPDEPLRHADRDIAAGHAYRYRVVVVGADGSRLGVSNLVTIRFGRALEQLRFNCAWVVDGDVSGAACHWSAATRPAAVRYVLYRSVDGAAREAVYETPLDGRRAFLDTDVAAGQSIRYAVVAVAERGRVTSVGGPDRVVVPAPATSAVAR